MSVLHAHQLLDSKPYTKSSIFCLGLHIYFLSEFGALANLKKPPS
jgi:hypothetical protein